MSPLISIVIPAYNAAPFLKTSIQSALDQRDVEYEVIVVDDGSTDETAAVLTDFTDISQLQIVRHENRGPSASRNTALQLAKGEYVGFLDADDLWNPMKAAAHIALMETSPNLDLTYSWWQVIDEIGNPTGRFNITPIERLPAGATFEGLLLENFTGTASTVICRRTAVARVGGFDSNLRANVDLDLWLRIAALRDGNIGLVPNILTSYRKHSSQITSNWSRMASNWEKVIDKARKREPRRVLAVECAARARLARYLAYIAYDQRDFSAARKFIAQAWSTNPFSLICDRRSWLTTAAIAATMLPRKIHDGLARSAKSHRSRRHAA